MFCQLDVLRHCLPPSVRRTLSELPESLDETYERVLRGIKKPNRNHALRVLQCLVVAIRPLEVKELAEVLALDFDNAEGIPKLKPDWRWEDEEQALLTSCSSLIATVDTDDSRIVQFSHFSVKEYLTSERLATSNGDVSRYHIDLEPAHTILTQACMGILLLRPDDHVEENGVGKKYPLAGYAAEHWVKHAQFERVSTFLRKAMEYLFDPDKPYFAAWLQLHDIDTGSEDPFHSFSVARTSGAIPLYYAALCGFQDLVEHLVAKYPQHVNTSGGEYGTPLVAALAGRHFQTARHLLHNGAQVDVRDEFGFTPLSSASWYGDLEMVQLLLDYKADANTRSLINNTPMHRLSLGFQFLGVHHHSPQMLADIARSLLEHGADLNAQANDGLTPLHKAAEWGQVEVVSVFLEHGANVGVEDNQGATPLHAGCGDEDNYLVTTYKKKPGVVRMLLKHGANIDAKDKEGRTPLHVAASVAAQSRRIEVVRVEHIHWGDIQGETPLHAGCSDEETYHATNYEKLEVLRLLLEHGASVGAKDNKGRTPLHVVSQSRRVKSIRMFIGQDFLRQDANVGAENNQGASPLHAGYSDEEKKPEAARTLLKHGANVDAKDSEGRTPLHIAAQSRSIGVVRVLLEHGANVGAEDNQGKTPFQIVSAEGDEEDEDEWDEEYEHEWDGEVHEELMILLSGNGVEGVL